MSEVSGPLEHLFTLNLDRLSLSDSLSQDIKSDSNSLSLVKPVKKVRFADELTENDVDSERTHTNETNTSLRKDMKGILKVKGTSEETSNISSELSVINCENSTAIKNSFNEESESEDFSDENLSFEKDSPKDDVLLNDNNCSDETGISLQSSNEFHKVREDKICDEEFSSLELSKTKFEMDGYFDDTNINIVREDNEDVTNDVPCSTDVINENEKICVEEESQKLNNKIADKSLEFKPNSNPNKTGKVLNKITSMKKTDKVLLKKKMERHFKTCLGVGETLNSGNTADSSLQMKDENLTSEQKMSKSKQTTILNSILLKDPVTAASATNLKQVVFKAWHQAKYDKTKNNKNEDIAIISTDKKDNKLASDAYKFWKQSKEDSIKKRREAERDRLHNVRSKEQENKKNDKEEGEMAFKSWKKQKEEMLLKKQAAASKQKQEKKLNEIMLKEIKRKDAEMAFLAWKAQKSQESQIKKKTLHKALEVKKENDEVKARRDKEAQEIYHIWLQTKVSIRNFPSWHAINNRPPWTPPGRSILDSSQCV